MHRLVRAASVRLPAFCFLFLSVSVLSSHASEIVYPPGSNIANVVEDYGVDNTGETDVTDTLRAIFESLNTWRTIYLPKGTYKVSGTVACISRPRGKACHGPMIIGQSRKETIIRLVDGTWPEDSLDFGSYPGRIDSQVVLHSGDCTNTSFEKSISNLTVNIGKNNDGAIGVVYIGSNSGAISEVDIISEDGKGSIGLSLSGSENGPALARNVYVKGFKRGVYSAASCHISVSQVIVDGASEYGLVNKWRAAMDSIKITTKPKALGLLNLHNGELSLTNGFFEGSKSKVAIKNTKGNLYLRNIHTKGFGRALQVDSGLPAPKTAYIEQYTSNEPVGAVYDAQKGLNLPIKYPRYPAWERDSSKWANPMVYMSDDHDHANDTEVLQKTFAEKGKTAAVLPFLSYEGREKGHMKKRQWNIDDTIRIGNDFERVVGTAAIIRGTTGAVVIEDGSAPLVEFRHFRVWRPLKVFIRTDRTVVFESVSAKIVVEGAGEVYVNDLMGTIEMKNPKARLWARKLNHEYHGPGAQVHAGTAWVLGYKSEGYDQNVHVGPQGALELFGYLNFNVYRKQPPDSTVPVFAVDNGRFSAAVIDQVSINCKHMPLLVREKRGDKVHKFYVDPDKYQASLFSLYTGYDPEEYEPEEAPAKQRDAKTGRKIKKKATGK